MSDTKKKHSKAARESALFLAIVAASLVLLNVLGTFVYGRVDLTEKDMFSLSKGSKNLANRLKDRLEIRAYFTKDLPYPYNALERYSRDILEEYEAASDGKIHVRYITPETDEEKEDAQRDGVQQIPTPDLREDRIGEVQAFRGMSFHYLGNTKAIPYLENTQGLEYQITQTIKELAGEKLLIGVLKGHESPSLEKGLTGIKQTLQGTYDFQEIDGDADIPIDMRAILVVNPQTPLSEIEIANLRGFVNRGGSLGIFGGSRKLPEQLLNGAASQADSSLNTLLKPWGVSIDSGMVADAECGSVNAPTNIPGLALPVRYPLLPEVRISEEQAEHPVLFRLNQLQLPFTSRVTVSNKAKTSSAYKTEVLAKSSDNSWLINDAEIDLSPRQQWYPSAQLGPFPLAVALEGKLGENANEGPMSTPDGDDAKKNEKVARVLVVGSGFAIEDRALPPADPRTGERPMTSTLAFALNTVDWLAQDADMVGIRAKNVEEPALKDPALESAQGEVMEALQERDQDKANAAFERLKEARAKWGATKSLYRWFHTLGLPVAFAVFGFFWWRKRKHHFANIKL
ncbi:MAG: GldG family protein [Myxococcales bacterium]|nr:MAG: GldG family protein [Myxococcales bacterium]